MFAFMFISILHEPFKLDFFDNIYDFRRYFIRMNRNEGRKE